MTEAVATITSHMSPNTPLLGGAPVTKTFVIFSALFYVISESMDWQDEIALGTLQRCQTSFLNYHTVLPYVSVLACLSYVSF